MTEKNDLEIEQLLLKLRKAFEEKDAPLLNEVYSDNVNWTNAFGTHFRDKKNVISYLEGLFKNQNFLAGKISGKSQYKIDHINENMYVVKTYSEIEGQKTTEGIINLRKTHSLKVLVKEDSGKIRIVADMYMDARNEITYA